MNTIDEKLEKIIKHLKSCLHECCDCPDCEYIQESMRILENLKSEKRKEWFENLTVQEMLNSPKDVCFFAQLEKMILDEKD